MLNTARLNSQIYMNTSDSPSVKKPAQSRILAVLIIVLAVILACESVFYLLVVPATSPAKIQFSSTGSLSWEEVSGAFGISGRERWSSIDTAELSRPIASYPCVAKVYIRKKFPDKLIISIAERTPAAVLLASLNNRTVPMEIDKTGMVFRIAQDDSYKRLPIISGLELEQPRTGMKVHKQLAGLFQQLDILQKKNPVLLSEISEIKIEQKKYGGFELIIYPVQAKMKVRTDSTLNEDRLRYMMLALDVVRDLGISSQIEELDIRGGTASYRLKEVSDE